MSIAKKLGRTKFQVWIISSTLASVMLALGHISQEVWAGIVGGTGGLYQIMEGFADIKARANGKPSE